MQKIQILVPELSPRIEYTFRLVFESLLKIQLPIEWLKEVSEDDSANSLQISYHATFPNFGHFYFHPHGLLSESTICKEYAALEFKSEGGIMASFFSQHLKAVFPFDPFALIFYLVSRYEEYTCEERDHHGRFVAQSSDAHRYNFLQKPLVNLWATRIKEKLLGSFPRLPFGKKNYTFLATYDIDHAFAFRAKAWWRQLGVFARNLVRMDGETLKLQWKTYLNKNKDPYDTFAYLIQLHQKTQVAKCYFFLLGDYGKYDKNIHYQNKTFQQLIQKLARAYPVGLHPSYASNLSIKQLKKEKARLENILNQQITKSRQHFLKLEFPNTYQNLLAIGVEEDYSMGYAHDVGFRASIAEAFQWFDLSRNKATNLLVHPFQYMDVTLHTYLRLKPKAALDYIQNVMQETKNVSGQLISLWHNNSLCEAWEWKGWREMYENFLSKT